MVSIFIKWSVFKRDVPLHIYNFITRRSVCGLYDFQYSSYTAFGRVLRSSNKHPHSRAACVGAAALSEYLNLRVVMWLLLKLHNALPLQWAIIMASRRSIGTFCCIISPASREYRCNLQSHSIQTWSSRLIILNFTCSLLKTIKWF